ncbi:unnamed protein product [Pipistrellus nathusii]|uniref:Uncharacterized protein n=1 Tax=Pipistrellus nathusii TaxID=59473 RepID=A0ABN9ZSS5_PIPNA
MVDGETLIQKTTTSLLLESSRIVTHECRLVCESQMSMVTLGENTMCGLRVLSLELGRLMLKSCTGHISWNMLPKFLELWSPRPVVGKLINQQSQISRVQRLKFLLRAKFFKLKLLQNRLAQAMVFCGRATLKGPKSCTWLESHSLPITVLD